MKQNFKGKIKTSLNFDFEFTPTKEGCSSPWSDDESSHSDRTADNTPAKDNTQCPCAPQISKRPLKLR